MLIEQIKKAKKGDKKAFEKIIMEHIDYFYRVAYGILKNEEDRADAISNTVLKIYENIKTLKSEKFFKTWATRILINECKNHLSKQNKIVYIEDYQQEQFSYIQEKEVRNRYKECNRTIRRKS